MITPAQRAEIRRLYYAEHWKIGTIAAQLGLHRAAVRAAVERESPSVPPRVWRSSIIDPYLPFIRDTLTQYPRLRATRIHEMVRQRGYAGSVFPVRKLVRRLRPETSRAVYRRVVTLAGESAQVDWGSFGKVRIGQGTRTVSGFVMVLGYSRALAALFTLDQTLESFLRGHVAAFDALGGAARNLVYDNLRSAVLDRRGAAVQFHPRLLELAGHYHFAPRPCTPGRGNEKGKIERKIQYLRHAYFAARPFRDLDDINTQFRRWRDEVAHRRPHPDQPNRSVAEVWAEEKPRLLPLPANPFETDLVRAVRSGKTPYVRFDRNLYSIPHTHVRKPLTPGRLGHPRPHPRRTDRADRTSPHLRHRADRRGPRPSGSPARRHSPGQRPHHPRPAARRRPRHLNALRAPCRASRGPATARHPAARPARRLRAAGAGRRRRHRPPTRCPRRRLHHPHPRNPTPAARTQTPAPTRAARPARTA